MAAGVIRLRAEHAKTGRARLVALDAGLKALVARRWAARQITGPDGKVTLCPLVFHRNGKLLGDFRKVWATACIKTGLFHVVKDADGTERKGTGAARSRSAPHGSW